MASSTSIEVIHKQPVPGAVEPNLPDYERARAQFSWASARAELAGLPGGALNIAHEAVGRHADGPLAQTVALRFLPRHGEPRELTYAQLASETSRFANVLGELGVERGERVFVLAGRIPELYIAALGALKHGAVFCPLFSAFGPEPIEQRLRLGDARVLVSTPALYARKVAQLRERLPGLKHVLLAGATRSTRSARLARPAGHAGEIADTRDLGELMGAAESGMRPRAPSRRTWRCCISPAAPPGGPRARCTSMARWFPMR
ncbi:MAG TPA: AMP-binding protein [Solirubrobacteraceae bacterium]|nr:AMP-binding protein [Solirubrobacteraceae bacterium]